MFFPIVLTSSCTRCTYWMGYCMAVSRAHQTRSVVIISRLAILGRFDREYKKIHVPPRIQYFLYGTTNRDRGFGLWISVFRHGLFDVMQSFWFFIIYLRRKSKRLTNTMMLSCSYQVVNILLENEAW